MKKIFCTLMFFTALAVAFVGLKTPVNAANLPEEGTVEETLQQLKGKIGPYEVTMFLNLQGTDVGQVVGYYYYNERPKTHFKLVLTHIEAINIKGSMKVILKEYTPKGNHTGTFNGQYECRGDYYAGTFVNSKGKKYKFELM